MWMAKKCPFCGLSSTAISYRMIMEKKHFFVMCMPCGTCGPTTHSATTAKIKWNNRYNDEETEIKGIPLGVDLVYDMFLAVTGNPPTKSVIRGWGQNKREQVVEWLRSVHLRASDNFVKRVCRPKFVPKSCE